MFSVTLTDGLGVNNWWGVGGGGGVRHFKRKETSSAGIYVPSELPLKIPAFLKYADTQTDIYIYTHGVTTFCRCNVSWSVNMFTN